MTKIKCSRNSTGPPEFVLLGFQILPRLKPLLFVVFFSIYTVTIASNVLIMFTVSADEHLHSPMYFFLANLSCLEIWYTTSIVPTMLGGLLMETLTVSLSGCIMQFFVFCWLASTECFLITVMAYDRYVAICHPLHYATIMDQRLCLVLAISSWVAGFIVALVTICLLCQLQFPDHREIDHFFCDLMPLTKAACSDPALIELEAFVFSFIVLSIPLLLIVFSYVRIISAILRIQSSTGRYKAFSTCSSHLVVVVTYFGILITVYMVPSAAHFLNLNKALSLLYTVGTPVFNPIVYTLRNKKIRGALRKAFTKELCFQRL
ncbi:olfactory receptor 11A1-like [Ambystoma mexicanum]|uniref:olfactory receptor 11A1-like n=1 Tax=Ambystoma mexicanum TaxID=8296 RepID=UPI0037E72FB3